MSSTTVAQNPFRHKFVKSLLKEEYEDDEAYKKLQHSKEIPAKTFVIELSYNMLSLFTMGVASFYFAIGLTGYGWAHSIDAMILDSDTASEHQDYTMFADNTFNLEYAAILLCLDAGIIAFGGFASAIAVYESARRKLLISFIFLVIGIPLELGVTLGAEYRSGGKCDATEFKETLENLLVSYRSEGNSTKGLSAVKKIHSLQISLGCCGLNSYKDFVDNGEELPFSCCIPAWTRNLYCAKNITDNKLLIDSRLNQMGCADKAFEMCGAVLYYYQFLLKYLIAIRLFFSIIQCFLLYRQLKTYKKQISEGIYKGRSIEEKLERSLHNFEQEPSTQSSETDEPFEERKELVTPKPSDASSVDNSLKTLHRRTKTPTLAKAMQGRKLGAGAKRLREDKEKRKSTTEKVEGLKKKRKKRRRTTQLRLRSRSKIQSEPVWAQSRRTSIIPDEDVGRTYVGGTTGLRTLQIKAELDIQPSSLSLLDEDEEKEENKVTMRKKRKKKKKRKDSKGRGRGSSRTSKDSSTSKRKKRGRGSSRTSKDSSTSKRKKRKERHPSKDASTSKERNKRKEKHTSEEASTSKEQKKRKEKHTSEEASTSKEQKKRKEKHTSKHASISKGRKKRKERHTSKDASRSKKRKEPREQHTSEEASTSKEQKEPKDKHTSEEASTSKEQKERKEKHTSEEASTSKEQKEPQEKHTSEEASTSKEQKEPTEKHTSEEASTSKDQKEPKEKPTSEEASTSKDQKERKENHTSEDASTSKEQKEPKEKHKKTKVQKKVKKKPGKPPKPRSTSHDSGKTKPVPKKRRKSHRYTYDEWDPYW